MAIEALPAERLRQYLSELTASARSLLVTELERSILRGEEMQGTELVLQELRRSLRNSGSTAARTDDAARAFFLVFEAFIVDDTPENEHPGRIARQALEPIWAWISRDLVPAEAEIYSTVIQEAVLAGDKTRTEQLTRAMQDQVAQAMDKAFAEMDSDDRSSRRLGAQIPIVNGPSMAKEILALLKSREALAAFSAQLPGHLYTLGAGEVAHIKSLLDHQLATRSEIFLHSLVTVMSRLSVSWQLIRLATKAADSDKTARVAATPYAAAVNIVLAEVERLVNELKADLKSGRGVAVIALLKMIHDAARGLRTEMDLTVDSKWSRRLAAIRTDISNLLKWEIESAPGRMRRLLRPRPAKDIAAGEALDPDDVAEVEALIVFVDACRKYAGELALNEMTLRTYSELQHYLESSAEPLLEGLRGAGEGDRRFRQSQLEAAVRFGREIFGAEYATALSKAVDVALATNLERRSRAS